MKDSRTAFEAPTVVRRDFFKFGGAAGALAMAALGGKKASAQQETVPAWDLLPRGNSRPVSIDVHSHWAPEVYTKALAQLGRPEPQGTQPLQAELDRRVKWMDQHGVQTLLLTMSGMPWQWVAPEEGARLARIVNDAGVEAHAAFPDRFIACIEIFVRDSEVCLKEIDRIAGKPGMRAVHLPNSLEGQRDYVFEPSFAPVLARCEKLGLPLVFHPLDGKVNYYGGPETRFGDPLSDAAGYGSTVGYTFEAATTATKFIITGTLDKFPGLQIVLPHAGGSFPYVAGRVEHGLKRRKFPLQSPFRDYIRRFHYDTLTYDLESLRFLVELVGPDRVLLGSDNGFGAKQNFEWPNAIVEHLNLPAADQDRIFRGNAKKLFGI